MLVQKLGGTISISAGEDKGAILLTVSQESGQTVKTLLSA
jgi:hypothetical protein